MWHAVAGSSGEPLTLSGASYIPKCSIAITIAATYSDNDRNKTYDDDYDVSGTCKRKL